MPQHKITLFESQINKLICVIATRDTVTMQYYLDEKMDYVNTIYIDNNENFKKAFFPDNTGIEYPAYFVITGNTVVSTEKLNNKERLKDMFSFLFSSEQ